MSKITGGVKEMSYSQRTGHERYRKVKKDSNVKAVARRKRALERLKVQLKLGIKQPENTFLSLDAVPLLLVDIERIKKEINILESRI